MDRWRRADLNEILITDDDDNQTFPVYSMSEHFALPWENEGGKLKEIVYTVLISINTIVNS